MASFDNLVGVNNGQIADTVSSALRISGRSSRYLELNRDGGGGVKVFTGSNGLIATFTNNNEVILANSDAAGTKTVLRWGDAAGMELSQPGFGRAQISAGVTAGGGEKQTLWLNRDGGNIVVGAGDGNLDAMFAFCNDGTPAGNVGISNHLILGTGTGTYNTTSGFYTGGPVAAAGGASSGAGFQRMPSVYEAGLATTATWSIDAAGQDVAHHAINTPGAYGRILFDFSDGVTPLVSVEYGYNVSGVELELYDVIIPPYPPISKGTCIKIATQFEIVEPVFKLTASNFLDFNGAQSVPLLGNIADITSIVNSSVPYAGATAGKYFYIDTVDTITGSIVETVPTVSGIYFIDFEVLGTLQMIV